MFNCSFEIRPKCKFDFRFLYNFRDVLLYLVQWESVFKLRLRVRIPVEGINYLIFSLEQDIT